MRRASATVRPAMRSVRAFFGGLAARRVVMHASRPHHWRAAVAEQGRRACGRARRSGANGLPSMRRASRAHDGRECDGRARGPRVCPACCRSMSPMSPSSRDPQPEAEPPAARCTPTRRHRTNRRARAGAAEPEDTEHSARPYVAGYSDEAFSDELSARTRSRAAIPPAPAAGCWPKKTSAAKGSSLA